MWTQRESDIFMLAITLWRESRGEMTMWKTQRAIGWVVRHRVESTWDHRNTYQDVCDEPWQFSSLTAPGDPNLVKWPKSDDVIWRGCLAVAETVIPGCAPPCQIVWEPEQDVSDPVPGAVFYHDARLPAPPAAWGPVTLVATIGNLSFYRMGT